MKIGFVLLLLTYCATSMANSCLMMGAEGVVAAADAAKVLSQVPVVKIDPQFCKAINACMNFGNEDDVAQTKKNYEEFNLKLPERIAEAKKKIEVTDVALAKLITQDSVDPKELYAQKHFLKQLKKTLKSWELYAAKLEELTSGGKVPTKMLPYDDFASGLPIIETSAQIANSWFNQMKSYYPKMIEESKKTIEKNSLEIAALEADPKTPPQTLSQKKMYLTYYEKGLKTSTDALEIFQDFEKDPKNKEIPQSPYDYDDDTGQLLKEENLKNIISEESEKNNPNCDATQDLYKDALSTVNYRKAGTCAMTPEELTAVKYYSDSGYGCMNSYLREQTKKNENLEPLIEAMNSGLSKLPNYLGVVRRGGNLPASVRAKHTVGSTVDYPAFTSTSTAAGFGSNDLFMIYSQTGKPIMGFSSHAGEHEVLFRSGAKFKVLDVQNDGKGRSYFVMKEISGKKSTEEEAADDKKLLDLVKAQAEEAEKAAAIKAVPATPVATEAAPPLTPVVASPELKAVIAPAKKPVLVWDDWTCPLDEKAEVPKDITQKTIPGFKVKSGNMYDE
jgi:NAD:arginine ADP-ribosyltransferase